MRRPGGGVGIVRIDAGIREALERRDELVRAGLAHASRFTWRACGEVHLRAWEEAVA